MRMIGSYQHVHIYPLVVGCLYVQNSHMKIYRSTFLLLFWDPRAGFQQIIRFHLYLIAYLFLANILLDSAMQALMKTYSVSDLLKFSIFAFVVFGIEIIVLKLLMHHASFSELILVALWSDAPRQF